MNSLRRLNKIIFIQGNLYPYDLGGHEVFNFYLYNELRRKYDVKVLSNYRRPVEISESDYLKVPKIKPLGLFFSLFSFMKLIFLARDKPTVVLTFSRSNWINWWPYPVLNKLFDLRYVIIIHGGGVTKWPWKYPFLKLFTRASEVIGISKRICDEYSNRTGINVKHLLPLIPFEKSSKDKSFLKNKWGLLEVEKIFLVVGSIKQLKNPGVVIAAAELLGTKFLKNHNIKFVFAGDGILLPFIKAKVEELCLEEYFQFLGRVERSLIPEIYRISDIYLINSDFEGTPLSLLEAMYNELLIIGADSPGINNIVKNNYNGLLYKTKNAQDLALSIKKSLEINDQLIVNGVKTFKKDFDYKKMIKEYENIFNNR